MFHREKIEKMNRLLYFFKRILPFGFQDFALKLF